MNAFSGPRCLPGPNDNNNTVRIQPQPSPPTSLTEVRDNCCKHVCFWWCIADTACLPGVGARACERPVRAVPGDRWQRLQVRHPCIFIDQIVFALDLVVLAVICHKHVLVTLTCWCLIWTIAVAAITIGMACRPSHRRRQPMASQVPTQSPPAL
jgi:hypothetical protein